MRARITAGAWLSGGKTMIWEKPHLLVGYRVERGFKTLVDRTIRKQRCEERRLAERRNSKHRFQARKSCILDAQSYPWLDGYSFSPGHNFD